MTDEERPPDHEKLLRTGPFGSKWIDVKMVPLVEFAWKCKLNVIAACQGSDEYFAYLRFEGWYSGDVFLREMGFSAGMKVETHEVTPEEAAEIMERQAEINPDNPPMEHHRIMWTDPVTCEEHGEFFPVPISILKFQQPTLDRLVGLVKYR